MTDFAEVKISQFSPVPGKHVNKTNNPQNPLHPRKHSPIVSPRHGGVAQLGERLTGSQEVRGSIPLVSTTVNAKPPGNWRLFSYEATAQIKVTPHQHPHPKKLRNLFPTSVHSLLTEHNSLLQFPPSALQLGLRVPTATPA